MATASQVVNNALSHLGKPYIFATQGPNTFDCSGFIYYVLKSCGFSIGRTSVAGYWNGGLGTSFSGTPKAGDLIYFQNTYTTGPSHMGIMISDSEFVHAESETTGVVKSKLSNSYYKSHFLGYRRLGLQQEQPPVSDGRFADVPRSHWAYNAIEYLAVRGIMMGYGDGYFGAQDGVIREHAAAFLYRAIRPADSDENPFVDIEYSPFKKEILALTKHGVFTASDYFSPTSVASRAVAAVIIARAFNLTSSTDYQFADTIGHWADPYIKALYSNGIAAGTGDNRFRPEEEVTREQFAMFLYKALTR
ncbi:TPA: S-layer homology domain-containing protein [Bacillus pacificus]|nr:S-layer homology domain-containing protein [Bacillus pacificus]